MQHACKAFEGEHACACGLNRMPELSSAQRMQVVACRHERAMAFQARACQGLAGGSASSHPRPAQHTLTPIAWPQRASAHRLQYVPNPCLCCPLHPAGPPAQPVLRPTPRPSPSAQPHCSRRTARGRLRAAQRVRMMILC